MAAGAARWVTESCASFVCFSAKSLTLFEYCASNKKQIYTYHSRNDYCTRGDAFFQPLLSQLLPDLPSSFSSLFPPYLLSIAGSRKKYFSGNFFRLFAHPITPQNADILANSLSFARQLIRAGSHTNLNASSAVTTERV